MAKAATFSRDSRLCKRRQFLTLYREAERIHTRFFVVYIQRNNLTRSRLGITASRKVGSPVVRNRIKRRLREIFRQGPHDIRPAADLVVNVKRNAARASFSQLCESLGIALRRWEDRCHGEVR